MPQFLRDLLRVGRGLLRQCPHPEYGPGLIHDDVHRETASDREAAGEFVDASLPFRRYVQGNPFWSEPGHLQDFPDVRQGRLQERLGSFGLRIDLLLIYFRIRSIDDESLAADPMPDFLGDVRRERSQDLRLDLDEPTEGIGVRPVLRST